MRYRGLWAAWVMLLLLALPVSAMGQAVVIEPDTSLTVRNNRVTLAFSAPVEIEQTTVEVANADGKLISSLPVLRGGDPQVVTAKVAPGQTPVFLRWRTLSRDGHVTAGAIGTRGPQPPQHPVAEAVVAAGRGLVVAALAVILGLVMFRWGVVGAAWSAGGLWRPGDQGDAASFKQRVFPVLEWASNRWWDVLWVATACWGVGLLATVAGTLAALESRDVGALLLYARLGHAAVALVILGVITVVLGNIITRRSDGDDPLPPVWQAICLGAPAAIGLGIVSWSGHAATGSDATLNIALDAVHNIATAAWVGGLAGLITLVLPTYRRLNEPDDIRLTSAAVVRFSMLGVVAVALLVVTGVYRAIAEVGALSDLFSTTYGLVLVAKVLVFAAMCVVAGYNRFSLHPRLERAALGLRETDEGAAMTLRSTVKAELALAAVLLVLVAALIGGSPPG